MQDRRRCVRWQTMRQAKIELAPGRVCADCRVNNINYKGAQIFLLEKLQQDSYIKIKLILSENCELEVEAWVAWQKTVDGHNICGLYFSKIKDADKEKIYGFIRSEYPQQLINQWWGKGLTPRPIGGTGVPSSMEGGENMQGVKTDDRRTFERFALKSPLKFLDVNTDEEGRGETFDLSAKGIGLVTAKELAPNTSLELWLTMPDKLEPFYTRGEVVWSKPTGANEYRAGINLERANLMAFSRALRLG